MMYVTANFKATSSLNRVYLSLAVLADSYIICHVLQYICITHYFTSVTTGAIGT